MSEVKSRFRIYNFFVNTPLKSSKQLVYSRVCIKKNVSLSYLGFHNFLCLCNSGFKMVHLPVTLGQVPATGALYFWHSPSTLSYIICVDRGKSTWVPDFQGTWDWDGAGQIFGGWKVRATHNFKIIIKSSSYFEWIWEVVKKWLLTTDWPISIAYDMRIVQSLFTWV